MNSDHLERRAAQRFPFQLTVAIRLVARNLQGSGFTQDLSARGALLYTDLMPSEGEAIELTLIMPSEITLAENMPVCCRGKVVRVARLESKYEVAVHIETYEFLPEVHNSAQATGSFARIAALHNHRPEEETAEFVSPQRPVAS
jgi:hypothetical protein